MSPLPSDSLSFAGRVSIDLASRRNILVIKCIPDNRQTGTGVKAYKDEVSDVVLSFFLYRSKKSLYFILMKEAVPRLELELSDTGCGVLSSYKLPLLTFVDDGSEQFESAVRSGLSVLFPGFVDELLNFASFNFAYRPALPAVQIAIEAFFHDLPDLSVLNSVLI